MKSLVELKRNLKKDAAHLPLVKLALLGDSATQFLRQALGGYGIEVGLRLEIFESDYDQIDQQIRDPGSELWKSESDFIAIFQSSQKLLGKFYEANQEEKRNFATLQLEQIRDWLRTIKTHSAKAHVLCTNFPEIDDGVFGQFANKTPQSFLYQLRKLNLGLMELSQELPELAIVDFASMQNQLGTPATQDPRNYVDADLAISLEALPTAAKCLIDLVLARRGRFHKCLILDLDNTVWGGVIGDDGMAGIEVGHLGRGKAFTELQMWAKQLKERGILLAVCSKNTESIAKEPFESHPEMTLRLDDIAVFVANWESKVDNIRSIQAFLNIGFDSMVFVDDNPFERNVIRTHLPDVTVPELPEDPAEYLPYLRTLNLFETASFTEEDTVRTGQFKAESRRLVAQHSFTDENEFLASLEMVCEVRPFDSFSLPRVAQLIQRSNQFNLRTQRHSEADLARFAQTGKLLQYSFSLRDKFGDHGLISVVLVEPQDGCLFIDTWIMSCRVLRRGVESFVLNTLTDLARTKDFHTLVGEYLPTKKNALVQNHYADLGFVGTHDGRWQYDVCQNQPRPHHIKNGVSA